MINNSFFNNIAEVGGGVAYINKKQLFFNNTFLGNIAFYGKDISAYSIRVRLKDENNQTIFSINNVKPANGYAIFHNISIIFLDDLNQIVNSSQIKK